MADYPTRDGLTNIIIPAPGFKPGPNSLPAGGLTDQVLKKVSDNDFDMEWADESGGGGGFDQYEVTNRDGWILVESEFNAGATLSVVCNTLTSGTGANGGTIVTTSTAGLTRDANGVISVSTGTTATGRGGRALQAGVGGHGVRAGLRHSFAARVYVNNTPDATEDFYVFLGCGSNATSDPRAAQSFGLYYDRTYTNWQVLYHNGTTATYTDTGVPFAATTWFDLAIQLDGANLTTDVANRAYINGNLVHSFTGIASVTNLITFFYHITKLAGISARLMYSDYEHHACKRNA